jgi:CsoR family transcriptional regulator, copper-sensing transcriptional repressor
VDMDNITSALNRIEGQVRGIKKMCDEGRECEQITQQISAIQSALKLVAKEILTDEAVRCAKGGFERKKFERVIDSAVKIS